MKTDSFFFNKQFPGASGIGKPHFVGLNRPTHWSALSPVRRTVPPARRLTAQRGPTRSMRQSIHLFPRIQKNTTRALDFGFVAGLQTLTYT
jgi:hypothetical protein